MFFHQLISFLIFSFAFVNVLNIELNLLQKQIIRLQRKIESSEVLILKKEKEILKLKNDYGTMIYSLQKSKSNRNNLMFVISAENFNSRLHNNLSVTLRVSSFRLRTLQRVHVQPIVSVLQSFSRMSSGVLTSNAGN